MALALAVLAIWLYLLLCRGFWWRRPPESPGARPPVHPPRIVAVIPARNEAEVVGRAVASLAAQKYAGEFHIVLVDDSSTDGTAEAARAAAGPERLSVIRAEPLPPGWTGKLWAVSTGVEYAARFAPDYLLLTDADIVHAPDTLARLSSAPEYDLVSYMAVLHCGSLAERALIPAFVFFFFLLYPPAWIRNPRRRTAGAAGGCMLIRRTTLERIGGIAAIRGNLIDDCALAAAVKRSGGRVWLGMTTGIQSIREYRTFADVGRMISRSAFTQLRYSALLLSGTVAGMALVYLSPPALTLAGSVPGAAAWFFMSLAFLPILRFYKRSPLWAPLLPLIAAFYSGATIHSALSHWRGRGGGWKGRYFDPPHGPSV